MIYLKEFNTQAEYDAAVEANEIRRPNVSLVNEPFAVHYNKYVPLGVFIQHIDGSLYTIDEWSAKGFAKDEANGVAVVDEVAMFVVAKEDTTKNVKWGPYELFDGVFTSSNNSVAKYDYAGKKNTEFMVEHGSDNLGVVCFNYTFPNGQKGYLPSAGELLLIDGKYRTEIGNALRIIGSALATTNDRYYYSSTQYNGGNAWGLMSGREFINNIDKGSTNVYARAFTTLE